MGAPQVTSAGSNAGPAGIEVVLTDASLAKVIERTSLEMMQRMERDHELPGPNRPGRERAKARAGGDSAATGGGAT